MVGRGCLTEGREGNEGRINTKKCKKWGLPLSKAFSGFIVVRDNLTRVGAIIEIRLSMADGLPRQAATSFKETEREIMFYAIAAILLVLWVLGVVTGYTTDGFIHVLLIVALVMVFVDLFTGHERS